MPSTRGVRSNSEGERMNRARLLLYMLGIGIFVWSFSFSPPQRCEGLGERVGVPLHEAEDFVVVYGLDVFLKGSCDLAFCGPVSHAAPSS